MNSSNSNKAFRKGDRVTLVGSWDNKGTIYFQHAVVHSCGKKQMVLTDAVSGDELGRHFEPCAGDLDRVRGFNWQATFPRMSDADLLALCVEASKRVVQAERAEIAARLERWGDCPHYAANCQKSLDELHEPRVLRRHLKRNGGGLCTMTTIL